MNLTEEQIYIIEKSKNLSPDSPLFVTAFAGVGKTTTLKEVVKSQPGQRFIYLAFNRNVKHEMEQKKRQERLKNLEVYTLHGLAYRYLRLKGGDFRNYRLRDIVSILDLETIFKDKAYVVGYLVYTALRGGKWKDLAKEAKIEEKVIKQSLNTLLNYMKDTGIFDYEALLILFIEKLKGKNRIQRNKILLVDEAQDLNPRMEEILTLLKMPYIAVGDRHQAIYGWRGAVNFLSGRENVAYLSYSFRLPQNSGQVVLANKILRLKGESVPLKGANVFPERSKGEAVIFRTNTALTMEALTLKNRGVKYKLARPAKEILSLPIDIYRVFFRKQPPLKHFWLATFEDLKDFIKYIYRTQDIEAITAFRFVKKYKNPYEILQEIEDGEDREAEPILTTAHTAKGLEWRTVTIWDDFPDPTTIAASEGCVTLKDCLEMEKKGEYSKTIEEMNLAYVAITRAIKDLDCGIDWVYEVETERDFNERIKKAYEKQIKEVF